MARAEARAHDRARARRRRRDRRDADARHAVVHLAAVRVRAAVVGRDATGSLRTTTCRGSSRRGRRCRSRRSSARASWESCSGWPAGSASAGGSSARRSSPPWRSHLASWAVTSRDRDTRQIENPAASHSGSRARAARACGGTPCTVEDVSSVTKELNASADGFGPSAHVVLWNTLMDGRCPSGEVRFVVAHELGHVAHRHILKAVGWAAPGAPALLVRHRRDAAAAASRIPSPFRRAPRACRSRRRRRADRERGVQALRSGGRLVGAARDARHDVRAEALRRLPAHEPGGTEPFALVHLWLDDHPTLAQRLAMVEAFASRSRSLSLTPATAPPAGS